MSQRAMRRVPDVFHPIHSYAFLPELARSTLAGAAIQLRDPEAGGRREVIRKDPRLAALPLPEKVRDFGSITNFRGENE